jgi:hypothetical protein
MFPFTSVTASETIGISAAGEIMPLWKKPAVYENWGKTTHFASAVGKALY